MLYSSAYHRYGYLGNSHLPVSFNQSSPSPLISLINNVSLLTGCFLHHSVHILDTAVCALTSGYTGLLDKVVTEYKNGGNKHDKSLCHPSAGEKLKNCQFKRDMWKLTVHKSGNGYKKYRKS